jgi:hypothetical protein
LAPIDQFHLHGPLHQDHSLRKPTVLDSGRRTYVHDQLRPRAPFDHLPFFPSTSIILYASPITIDLTICMAP